MYKIAAAKSRTICKQIHVHKFSIIRKLHFASCWFTYSCGSQLHECKQNLH